MKGLISIWILLLAAVTASAQRTPRVVDSLSVLPNLVPSSSQPDVIVSDGTNGFRLFRYLPSNAEDTNATEVIGTATGTGRWKRIPLLGQTNSIQFVSSESALSRTDPVNGYFARVFTGTTSSDWNWNYAEGGPDVSGERIRPTNYVTGSWIRTTSWATSKSLGANKAAALDSSGQLTASTATKEQVDNAAIQVATVAAMRALGSLNDGTLIQTGGRSSLGDFGGALYRWDATSTATTNLGSVFAKSAGGSGRFLLLGDNTEFRAEVFGAVAGDGVNDAPNIQAALEYVYSLKRGTVRLGGGVYDISQTIYIPYRGNLKGADGFKLGEFASSNPTNSVYLTGGATMIRLLDGSNCDMVWFNSTDGRVRQPSETLEDGEVVDSLFQDSSVENIIFYGNAEQQTRYNLRGIAAKSKWTGRVKNCGFAYVSGFALWLFDVNAFVVDNVWISAGGPSSYGKGIFLYSSADNFIKDSYAGGSRGPMLWLNGTSTFKNELSDLILFNSYRTNSISEVASWTSNSVANFSTGQRFETGDPVEMRTTGNLPTGFTDTQLYFAVKFSTTSYGFHTNYALATNGVYLLGTGAASGTNWITIGPPSAIFSSGGAGQNVFSNVRGDQCSGPGFTLRDTTGNYISGAELAENDGSANGETVPDDEKTGLMLDKGALRNLVAGTVYSQNIGFVARSNAANNEVSVAFNSVSTNTVSTSSGLNYQPIFKDLTGLISLGTSTLGPVLDLTGNAAGDRILKMRRTSGFTQQIGLGVVSAGFNFYNETSARPIGTWTDTSTTSLIQFADGSSATPRNAELYATAGSGSNIAGGAIKFFADRSTGNADQADAYIFQTGDVGSSGSSSQSLTTKVAIEGDGDVRLASGLTVNANGTKVSRVRHGRATLVAGSVTVSDAYVTTSTRILLSVSTPGGTRGFLDAGTRSAGVSFTITSTSGTETSVVDWVSFEP